MRKCDVCGEYYSDTYRSCPFCEEEAAIRRGKPVHRRAKDFRNRRGGQAISILVLLLVFAAGGLAVGQFFGDRIADAVGIRTPLPPEEDTQGDPAEPDGGSDPAGDGSDPDLSGEPSGGVPEDDPAVQKPATAVMLSSADFTLAGVGAYHGLTASGGSGAYTWTSANPAIATVGADGTVTGVGVGNTEITATDGYTTAVCIVRVKGQETGGDTGGAVKLNKEDMTMPAGTTYQLKVSGTSSAVTWAVEDSSVAAIDGDGTVHFLKKGTTTATATVDGKTLTCIVRVKS